MGGEGRGGGRRGGESMLHLFLSIVTYQSIVCLALLFEDILSTHLDFVVADYNKSSLSYGRTELEFQKSFQIVQLYKLVSHVVKFEDKTPIGYMLIALRGFSVLSVVETCQVKGKLSVWNNLAHHYDVQKP